MLGLFDIYSAAMGESFMPTVVHVKRQSGGGGGGT